MGWNQSRSWARGLRVLVVLPLLACMSLFLSFVFAVHKGTISRDTLASIQDKIFDGDSRRPNWAGFENVEKFFVFGDSFSDTQFDVNESPPSASSPLGNPGYPKDRIQGPNWVHFITETYNRSQILTYSFARGASTVDQDVIENFFKKEGLSFKEQVNEVFLPIYASDYTSRGFQPNNTLFGIFFGVNEIELNYFEHKHTPVEPIFESYYSILEQLYEAGARNFLVLTVPPIDIPRRVDPEVDILSFDIHEFNKRIMKMRTKFSKAHRDVTIWVFDLYTSFSKFIDTPLLFEQTENLKDTRNPCGVYSWGLIPPNGTEFDYEQKDYECEYKMNEYFWLNDFHPTYPVYNATAAAIVEDCFTAEKRRRWCL